MGPKGTVRVMMAAERRFQREALKRQRELARFEKEKAKLSAQEQARLEVSAYENQVEILLSVHKEPCEEWDWLGFASALSEPFPKTYFLRELRAKGVALLADAGSGEASDSAVQRARAADEQNFAELNRDYAREKGSTDHLRALALRILAGESMAFIEAFAEFNPVAEISPVGSLKQFAVESDGSINCVFKVNAKDVIPIEVKVLTASGKVSVRAMSKSQFHQLYQDYICACVIRMAREVFAMLPIQTILVTALADVTDGSTEQMSDQPVLSVAVGRRALGVIDFNQTAASAAIEGMLHRGDIKASRGRGSFKPIIPLAAADLPHSMTKEVDLAALCASVRSCRDTIRAEAAAISGSTQLGTALSGDET
jgi:hypothetical protein